MIYPLVALPRLHTIILWEESLVSVLTSQAAIEASFQPLIQAATDILKKHEQERVVQLDNYRKLKVAERAPFDSRAGRPARA